MPLSPWLVHRALNVPGRCSRETLQSFRLLGLSLPFVITTAGLRGLLEAHQRFGLINALRVPMGVFTFAGPLLVLPFSKSLVPVVATLVAGTDRCVGGSLAAVPAGAAGIAPVYCMWSAQRSVRCCASAGG